MPRTSRSVAQRLAAKQSSKSKKRRAPRSAEAAPASSVSVDQILDEVVPSEGGARAAATPTMASDAPSPAAGTADQPTSRRGSPTRTARVAAKPAGRVAAPRRRYHEYAAEYQYVWTDFRRIVIVAGVLVVLLIALSFFIR